MAMPLSKQGNKNFFFLAIVQWYCRKWGGKKKRFRNLWKSKKKKKSVMSTIFLQYFHNKSHVISYYQLKKICDKLIVAMVLPKQGKKNCDKLIVAMPLPKQGGKKFFVAMALPKQGGKKIL